MDEDLTLTAVRRHVVYGLETRASSRSNLWRRAAGRTEVHREIGGAAARSAATQRPVPHGEIAVQLWSG